MFLQLIVLQSYSMYRMFLCAKSREISKTKVICDSCIVRRIRRLSQRISYLFTQALSRSPFEFGLPDIFNHSLVIMESVAIHPIHPIHQESIVYDHTKVSESVLLTP